MKIWISKLIGLLICKWKENIKSEFKQNMIMCNSFTWSLLGVTQFSESDSENNKQNNHFCRQYSFRGPLTRAPPFIVVESCMQFWNLDVGLVEAASGKRVGNPSRRWHLTTKTTWYLRYFQLWTSDNRDLVHPYDSSMDRIKFPVETGC
jgi:hypothetical protein